EVVEAPAREQPDRQEPVAMLAEIGKRREGRLEHQRTRIARRRDPRRDAAAERVAPDDHVARRDAAVVREEVERSLAVAIYALLLRLTVAIAEAARIDEQRLAVHALPRAVVEDE